MMMSFRTGDWRWLLISLVVALAGCGSDGSATGASDAATYSCRLAPGYCQQYEDLPPSSAAIQGAGCAAGTPSDWSATPCSRSGVVGQCMHRGGGPHGSTLTDVYTDPSWRVSGRTSCLHTKGDWTEY